MNSRVVLAAIASLTLTIVISGCSSGAAEKSSPAANPIKPAVSNSNKSGNDPVGFSDREVGPIGLNLIWSYHHPNKIHKDSDHHRRKPYEFIGSLIIFVKNHRDA